MVIRSAYTSAAFMKFAQNQDPVSGRPLVQKVDNRWLVHNRPSAPLEQSELDEVHAIRWMLDAPPSIRAQGKIRALDTIRFGVTTHRGCYGECRFCAIAVHQGRRIVSRSKKGIVEEVKGFVRHPMFRGTVSDVGGPTANMYGFDCARKAAEGACRNKSCLFPRTCPALKPDHRPQLELLRELRGIQGVKHVFVASGIRPDLVSADRSCGDEYVSTIARHHVSGQLKLAPEHVVAHVLECMGKPGVKDLMEFKRRFDAGAGADIHSDAPDGGNLHVLYGIRSVHGTEGACRKGARRKAAPERSPYRRRPTVQGAALTLLRREMRFGIVLRIAVG